jgi:hypothetical protein
MRLKLTVILEYEADPLNYKSGQNATAKDCAAEDQRGFRDDFEMLFAVLSSGDGEPPLITVEPVVSA